MSRARHLQIVQADSLDPCLGRHDIVADDCRLITCSSRARAKNTSLRPPNQRFFTREEIRVASKKSRSRPSSSIRSPRAQIGNVRIFPSHRSQAP